MPAVALLSHRASLAHDTGAHPENAARIPAIERALAERGFAGVQRLESPAASSEALLRVHPGAHVEAIRALCESGGGPIDADTVTSPGSYTAALHGAGGAVAMVDLLLGGAPGAGPRSAFSVARPPGHHAEAARAMGFCLFNSVAVAARHAQAAHGCERVLVLDWDVHHGNGTSAIFHTDPSVLFVSIHQWPLYPGTGAAGDEGAGPGLGHTVNLPVPAGAGDETFGSLVEHLVVALLAAFAPGLVLVSAGYDAHAEDPLAACRVTDEGYFEMAASLRRACEAAAVPLGLVLEGGYALDALGRSVAATVAALAAEPAPEPAARALSPVTARAAARVARHWPGLDLPPGA